MSASALTTDDDENAIVLAVANRTPVAEIARAYRLTISDVNAIIERRASEMFSGDTLRKKMFIEDARLQALGELHYQRGKEGCVQSGALYVKISERRATLSGMNAPSGHIVQLVGAANARSRRARPSRSAVYSTTFSESRSGSVIC